MLVLRKEDKGLKKDGGGWGREEGISSSNPR